MITKSILRLLVFSSLLAVALPTAAQDTVKADKSFYYRGILGGGSGSGRFFTGTNSTLGLDLEFMLERNKTIYGIGGKSLSTFKISIMNNYMQSYMI